MCNDLHGSFYLCLTVSAELLPWHGHPSSACKTHFSETIKQINAIFCGKIAVHHISIFSIFKNFGFLNFNNFFFFFTFFFSFLLTWDPMGVKISKHYSQRYRSSNFFTVVFIKVTYLHFEILKFLI